jgi:hypothetical protein
MDSTVVIIPTYNERENLERIVARVRVAADQLHDDVDVGTPDDLSRVADELDAVQRDAALLFQVPRARHLDDDVAPRAARDLLAVSAQHLDRAAAHRAQAEQADVDGLHLRFRPMGRSERTCVK